MAGQKQDDQHKHTYSSYARIRDVALKTCQRRWTIGKGGERGSGIFRASGTTWWWWSSICIKIQMLIFKQGSIKYHFLTLWYDSTWDWTPVSRTIVEHSTVPSNIKCFNGPVNLVSIIWMCMCASVPHLITLTLSFLEAAPNKTTAVRPSTSYPTRHPTKENLTCGTLQVKKGRTFSRRCPIDGRTSVGRPAKTSTMCGHWM